MITAGESVTGSKFIGRESEIGDLLRIIKDGRSCSIYGMPRVGKTSLVLETIRRINENPSLVGEKTVRFFEFTLSKASDNWIRLFEDFVSFVLSNAEDFKASSPDLHKKLCSLSERVCDGLYSATPKINPSAICRLCSCFFELSETEIWIVIDEMDYANESLGNNIQVLREMIAKPAHHTKAINISRHSLASIFPRDGNGSNYPGVISENLIVKGFDNNEIDLFKSKLLQELPSLSDEAWQQMLYYGGNVPYFLAILSEYVLDPCEPSMDEFCKNPLMKYSEAIEFWFSALCQLGSFETVLRFVSGESNLNLVNLVAYGVIVNGKLSIPFLEKFLQQKKRSDSGDLVDEYLGLSSSISLLLERGNSLLIPLFRDPSKLQIVKTAIADLNAMSAKIEYIEKLQKIKSSFLFIDAPFDELNAFRQRICEINDYFEGVFEQ